MTRVLTPNRAVPVGPVLGMRRPKRTDGNPPGEEGAGRRGLGKSGVEHFGRVPQARARTWRRAVLHNFHVMHAPHAGRAAGQSLRHGWRTVCSSCVLERAAAAARVHLTARRRAESRVAPRVTHRPRRHCPCEGPPNAVCVHVGSPGARRRSRCAPAWSEGNTQVCLLAPGGVTRVLPASADHAECTYLPRPQEPPRCPTLWTPRRRCAPA
jgi:hypothetical protein